MRAFFEASWNTLSKEVKVAQEKDKNIVLNEDLKEEVFEDLHKEYDSIKDKYMSKQTQFLDRHKVVAILVYLIIEKDIIQYNGKLNDDEIFLGKELIATSVAFSAMFDMLKAKLLEKNCELKSDAYYMPIAMSCKTPYQLIFARNLRYCKESNGINILELSEKLFLLETITLLKNNIDPRVIAEYNV